MVTLIEEKYRHWFGRKLDSWEEANCGRYVIIDTKDLKQLVTYDSKQEKLEDPFSDLPRNHPMVFLVKNGKRLYLVNTEGYDYSRYVVPAIVR